MTDEERKARPSGIEVASTCLVGGLFTTLLVAVPRAWLVTDRFAYPKSLLFHAAALLTGIACLAWVRRWRFDAVDLAVGAFGVLGVLSALLVAHNPWLALSAVGVTLSGSVLFLGARALAERGRREALLLAVALVAGLLALSMLLEAYGVAEGLSMLKRAPGGLLGHRNRAAHLLVLALPVCWLCFTRERDSRRLGMLGVCAVAMGAAITLSRTRTAWLAVLVLGLGIGGGWALGHHRVRGTQGRSIRFVVALLVGGGLALVLPNALSWRGSYVDTLLRIGEHDAGSGRGRLVQYGNTLRMVADAPLLGVGPGNWTVHYPRYATPGDPSHEAESLLSVPTLPQSDWLGLLAERGIPALLVLATLAGLLLVGCWNTARARAPAEQSDESLALMAVLAVLTVLGALDTVLLTPPATFFTAVVVGALARPQREWGVFAPGRMTRAVAIAGVVLLTVAPLAYNAVHGWARKLAYIQPQTVERLTRASRLDPGNYEARVFLGRMKARAGQCDEALAILRQATHLLPHAEAPLREASACQPRMSTQ